MKLVQVADEEELEQYAEEVVIYVDGGLKMTQDGE